ncbi:MAG: HAMP domain-containing histidine kinase [Acetatifactor sp.]|nr:HAMP domain-containing histidine kinase [Acetatifactor sp.]
MQKSETKRQGKRGILLKNWLTCGIVVCLICSAVFVGIYHLIADDLPEKSGMFSDNPYHQQSGINWLYASNYLLYKDLYNQENSNHLSYNELYLEGLTQRIEELEEELETYGWSSGEEIGEYGWSSAGTSVKFEELQLSWQELSQIQNMLQEYFAALEESYNYLNQYFDYMILDTETGKSITNTGRRGGDFDISNYVFYLSFTYDQNGNVEIGEPIVGSDLTMEPENILKYAGEAARNITLSALVSNYADRYTVSRYVNFDSPRNCQIIYGVSIDTWEKLEREKDPIVVYNYGTLYFGNVLLWDYVYGANSIYLIGNNGGFQMISLLLIIVLLLAFFLPGIDRREPWKSRRFFRLPLEFLWILGAFLLGWEYEILSFEQAAYGKTLINDIADVLPAVIGNTLTQASPDMKNVLHHVIHYACLTFYFFFAWYMGLCLRNIRHLKLFGYLKERSLIGRLCVWVYRKCRGVYVEVTKLDLTIDARKLIRKVVLVNAIILFGISFFWFGGLALVIVYSIVLYMILRNYVSDVQKKYGLLLSATNRIAEGNLNVAIEEDLGVFEPFKPQIYRIEEGFRKAVEEETKSQRMKSELITNVSHDLKTPLTAIITYIDLLKDENLSEEQRMEYLRTLEQKSLRLKVMIEDLFEVSKANSQTMPLHPVEVDLGNLLRQVAFEMEDKLKEAELELRMSIPEGKVSCMLDSQRTYRIFENLFGNISKYALHGTRVYVECRSEEGKAVVILKNITADEISVSPEELTERFVRGDVSRGTEGNGLGLAIARSFAEIQGGHLIVDVDGDLFKVTVIF